MMSTAAMLSRLGRPSAALRRSVNPRHDAAHSSTAAVVETVRVASAPARDSRSQTPRALDHGVFVRALYRSLLRSVNTVRGSIFLPSAPPTTEPKLKALLGGEPGTHDAASLLSLVRRETRRHRGLTDDAAVQGQIAVALLALREMQALRDSIAEARRAPHSRPPPQGSHGVVRHAVRRPSAEAEAAAVGTATAEAEAEATASLKRSEARLAELAKMDTRMLEYGAQLASKAHAPFGPHYLRFDELLHAALQPPGAADGDGGREVLEERTRAEIERVHAFFAAEQRAILDRPRDVVASAGPAAHRHALRIMRLVEFASVNVAGFRALDALTQTRPWLRPLRPLQWLPLQDFHQCRRLRAELDRVHRTLHRHHTAGRNGQRTSCEAAAAADGAVPGAPPELIVFDKDGTLVTLAGVWGPWIEHRVQAVLAHPAVATHIYAAASFATDDTTTAAAVAAAAEAAMYASVGYDPATEEVTGEGALLAYADPQTIEDAVRTSLLTVSIEAEAAAVAVEEAFADPMVGKGCALPVRPDVAECVERLRADHGVAVGVVTTDVRESTVEDLEELRLLPALDPETELFCGDDPTPPKPNPAALLRLCDHFGVHPSRAWMVGDTRNDIIAGRAAGFGAVVGVRTGVAGDAELGVAAVDIAAVDLMVDDVTDIPALLDGRPRTDTRHAAGGGATATESAGRQLEGALMPVDASWLAEYQRRPKEALFPDWSEES